MKVLWIVLAVAMLVAAQRAAAQGAVSELAFAPASSTAPVGASIAVDVTVANVATSPGLGGYDVSIAFNPATVRMDSLTHAGLLTGGSNIVLCTPAQIDNTAGKATAACTPIPLFSSPGFSTAAPIAMLHASFTALASGTSSLDLTGSTLQDPSGAALAATLGAGTINVAASATAAATPRASATPPPASPTQVEATTQTRTDTPTSSPTPRLNQTATVAGLRAPAAGTGGGSGRSRWPILTAVAAVAAVAGGATLLIRMRRTRA